MESTRVPSVWQVADEGFGEGYSPGRPTDSTPESSSARGSFHSSTVGCRPAWERCNCFRQAFL
jgi:hypothetical protein